MVLALVVGVRAVHLLVQSDVLLFLQNVASGCRGPAGGNRRRVDLALGLHRQTGGAAWPVRLLQRVPAHHRRFRPDTRIH